ncbi:MAG: signal peptidase II [Proteobacteria bacterium]|nr:signal peptidase II [Pseudomonadota bacterium]
MTKQSDVPTSGLRLWGPASTIGFWALVLTFLIDQAHKYWMIHIYHIGSRGRVQVLPFLDVVYMLNRGISYSLLTDSGPWLLTGFAVLVSALLWIWLSRHDTSRLMGLSLGLIIGGALANALDRIILGGVADFFSLHAFGFYWYVFNIADIAIVAGVIGLLYDSLGTSRNDASKAA